MFLERAEMGVQMGMVGASHKSDACPVGTSRADSRRPSVVEQQEGTATSRGLPKELRCPKDCEGTSRGPSKERFGSKERMLRPELQTLRQLIKQDLQESLRQELEYVQWRKKSTLTPVTFADHPEICEDLSLVVRRERRSSTCPALAEGKLSKEAFLDASLGGSEEEDVDPPFGRIAGRRLSRRSGSTSGGESDGEMRSEGASHSMALQQLREASGFKDLKETGRRFDLDDSDSKPSLVLQMLCPRLWVSASSEPRRDSCLANIVQSRYFNGFFTFVILMNAILMVFQIDYDVQHPSSQPLWQVLVERVFLVLYISELILKLCVHRLYFFWNQSMYWNLLDFALVMYSIVEIILYKIAGENSVGMAGWMRALRLFRIAKVLRILRVVKSFKELQLILTCVLGSMQSMVWSVVMLLIAFYMFSLILVQQTGIYLSDHSGNLDNEAILEYFGSVEMCMWTLFKAAFGGDSWSCFYQQVEKLGVMAQCVWFLFIIFTQIALLNILTGIFVESALQLAEGDAQSQALKHEERMLEDAAELRRMCLEWDVDGSRTMSREEFEAMTQSDDFSRYLRFIGLEMSNIQMFFDLITEDGGEVEIPTFVAGCMMLRGSAKSSDMMALMYEVKRLRQAQVDKDRELFAKLDELQGSMLSPSKGTRRASEGLSGEALAILQSPSSGRWASRGTERRKSTGSTY